MITELQKDIIKRIVGKFNPKYIGIFGSYARNESGENSDLDILVEFKYRMNLLDIIGLEQLLSEKLGVKVDLVTTASLNELIKPYIEKDLVRII